MCLLLSEKDFKFLKQFINYNGWELAQVYLLTTNATENEIKIQSEEVAEVKWLDYDNFVKLLYSKDFCTHNLEYKNWVKEVLK